VKSQPVEATWTDDPRKRSQARDLSGVADWWGARTTAVVMAPMVRLVVDRSHARCLHPDGSADEGSAIPSDGPASTRRPSVSATSATACSAGRGADDE
jgi:hypothetical protein